MSSMSPRLRGEQVHLLANPAMFNIKVCKEYQIYQIYITKPYDVRLDYQDLEEYKYTRESVYVSYQNIKRISNISNIVIYILEIWKNMCLKPNKII